MIDCRLANQRYTKLGAYAACLYSPSHYLSLVENNIAAYIYLRISKGSLPLFLFTNWYNLESCFCQGFPDFFYLCKISGFKTDCQETTGDCHAWV